MVIWETRRIVPMYAVPPEDLSVELTPCATAPLPDHVPPVLGPVNFALHLDPGQSFGVQVGDQTVEAAAFRPDDPDLGGRVILAWAPFEWTEEAQPVVGHPHDPFKRIDYLAADRHIVVSLDGTVLAQTRRPLAVYETHLPVRWYIPREDVDLSRLTPSTTTSVCAYKGVASYFSVDAPGGEDLAWTYPSPLHEALPLKDRVCFWSERSDLSVDGVAVPRPVTPWSPPAAP
jgi:uncharacterized protein (DUF427 family)